MTKPNSGIPHNHRHQLKAVNKPCAMAGLLRVINILSLVTGGLDVGFLPLGFFNR